MLSNLFRPRQSTNDRHAPLKSGPTSGQPTTDKAPSKLVMKLKAIKKVLRTNRSNSTGGDQAYETSERTYEPSPYDQGRGNLESGPFRTAERYDFSRASPIVSYHDVGSTAVSNTGTSHNGAPMTTRTFHPESDWPINPSLPPVALAVTSLAKSTSRFYEIFPRFEAEEEEALADTARIAVSDAHRAETQEYRSQQAADVIPHATSTTQRSNTAVAPRQSTEEERVPATTVTSKTEKQRMGGRNNWWGMAGNFRSTKRHLRREAVDFGSPNAPYCNAEQIAHEGGALKRGRANKRRERPQKHQAPKDPQGPTPSAGGGSIICRDTAKKAPCSIGNSVSKLNKHGSRFIEIFEEPHQPVGRLADQGNVMRDTAGRRRLSTPRHPLGSLDINVVLGGGAQELHQADTVEDSEDRDGSLRDNAEQGASFWFGEIGLSPSQGSDTDQL